MNTVSKKMSQPAPSQPSPNLPEHGKFEEKIGLDASVDARERTAQPAQVPKAEQHPSTAKRKPPVHASSFSSRSRKRTRHRKPKTSYAFFLSDSYWKTQLSNPQLPSSKLSTVASQQWKALPEQQRLLYVDLAKQDLRNSVGYRIFREEETKRRRQLNPTLTVVELEPSLKQMWNSLSDEKRQSYEPPEPATPQLPDPTHVVEAAAGVAVGLYKPRPFSLKRAYFGHEMNQMAKLVELVSTEVLANIDLVSVDWILISQKLNECFPNKNPITPLECQKLWTFVTYNLRADGTYDLA